MNFAFLAVMMSFSTALGQNSAIGVFTDHGDVGAVKNAGSVKYDAEEQSYLIAGSGANIWLAEDQFHFVWKKLSGNFVLRARVQLLGEGVEPHRKIGWMVRSTLDTDSPYIDVAVHGDGLTSMQFRRTKGANTEEVRSTVVAPQVIELRRKDGKYTMSAAKFGDTFSSEQLEDVALGDEVYVGMFVCAHNPVVIERAVFRNVRVVIPAADSFRPYEDYIGSHLEIMDVETGRRRIVHSVEDSLQAPNWTVDGKALIFNRNGRLYRFNLSSSSVQEIPSGFANRNNNDHVLSFDGKMLGISHHSDDDNGRSNVFTMPVAGGTPSRITSQGPSYLHGWSPDGKYLVYTAERDGDYDIYRIPATGGKEVRLTDVPGLDDGPEYAPDGKRIYFNSVRSGTMQIWRMNADGSGPEQLTDDEHNNWFPHVSPDGKTLVMLSFSREVDPTDHPFYKHVYLRRMRIDGGKPTVIAYVYGGQGTINVPSWSPDSRQIAFVSNSSGIVPEDPGRREDGSSASPGRIPQPGPIGNGPYQPQPILPGGIVVPLYSADSPFLNQARIGEAEKYDMTNGAPGRIQSIVNIHNPSIEIHTVDPSINTGTAIILAAGGGHRTLNVGTEAGDFVPYFYSFGVNTVILRNRLRSDGYSPQEDAVNDALQAIRLVRAHSERWGIDPNRIGIVGFSAGAELSGPAAIQFEDFDKRRKSAGSPTAGVSSRPDFVGLLYPGPTPFTRDPDTPVPRNAPPSFLATAGSGDRLHAIWAIDYFDAMLRAGIPNIELHVYGNGVHAGGLKDRHGIPFGTWQDRFVDWFRDLGFLQEPGKPTKAAVDSAAFVERPVRSDRRRGRR